jgi:hypothetical protein
MRDAITALAIKQDAYQIFGCALPYFRPQTPLQEGEKPRMYRYACAVSSVTDMRVELTLEHARFEFLANQRGGLHLFEGPGGLYFEARLPETAFARAIYQAVQRGQITNVCAMGTTHQSYERDGQTVINAYDLLLIGLLLPDSKAHNKHAFVTADRALFEQRKAMLDRGVRDWMGKKLEALAVEA